MLLSEDRYSYMTDYIKRAYGYSPEWCKKVSRMSHEQIFAIFCRLSSEERMKKEQRIPKPISDQLTIWDLIKEERIGANNL